ncbi:MAG: hypothetical protein MRY79_06740 [Alphaproteobacteria bacterium]|nr:hypothetical protein [Alphaproteobacteria bacterium]
MKPSQGHNGPRDIGNGEWERQVRINLSAEFASIARCNIDDPVLKPLKDILIKYNADLKNQFDAFADYCKAQEELAASEGYTHRLLKLLGLYEGATDSVLYKWTKDLVDNPEKEKQYAPRFTIYADGGKEVYDRDIADALEADLKVLLDSGMVTKVSNISSDPRRNPQAPEKFRK